MFGHEKFSVNVMTPIEGLCREIMKQGSLSPLSHTFCMALQLASWYKLFEKEVEDMGDRSKSHSDSKRTGSKKKGAIFHLESALVHYTGGAGTYNRRLEALAAHHPNVMEQAIHFWQACTD